METQYEELLEKYNTSDAGVKTWMTRLAELTSEILDLEDITQDALSEHLAAANGYGLNYTSTVFLMIHAALTEQNILIPMADIPVKLSDDEITRLAKSQQNTDPDMNERLKLSTNKIYNLRVDRENWYERPTQLKVDTEDIIKFMMLSRELQHLEPLTKLVRFIKEIPFTSCAESMQRWKNQLNVNQIAKMDITVTPITATYHLEPHTQSDKLVALVLPSTVTALRKGDNRYINWYMKEQM